jgi:hypothetical protein
LEGGLQGEAQDDSSIVRHDFASVSEQHLLEDATIPNEGLRGREEGGGGGGGGTILEFSSENSELGKLEGNPWNVQKYNQTL